MTAGRAFKAIVGPRGISITSTSYNSGTGVLTINFSDSSTFQTGDLRGTSGKGISSTSYNSGTGILTITFTDSSTYQTSDLRGAAGANGRGISSTSYNSGTGIVTITFTDSTTYQTGDLRGAAGAAGKGIVSASYVSTTGILTITFTDSTTFQTTDLRGATGATGKGITSTSYNATTGILTFTFSDSSTYQTGDLRAPNSSPLSYSFPLNETITANKIVQLLDSGKVEAITGIPVTKNLNNWQETTFAAFATDIIVKFDEEVGNRFVATFLDNSTNYYNAVVGTVAGNSITFGSKYVIQSTTGLTNVDFSFCKSQTNRIVFIYSAPTTGYLNAIVGTINGTALSFSSATLIKNSSCGYNKIERDPMNNNKLLVHFSIGVVHYLKVISLASDVLGITGSNYTVPVQGPNYGSVKFSNITSNRFLIATNYGSMVYATAGTISGTTISFGGNVVTFDYVDAWYLSLSFAYNSDKFGIVYRDNSTGYGQGMTGYLCGDWIVSNGSVSIFSTSGSIIAMLLVADRLVADRYACSLLGPGNSILLLQFIDYGYFQANVSSYQPFPGNKNCCGIGICFNNASSSLIYVAAESNTTVFGRVISSVYSPTPAFAHQYYPKAINIQIEFDPFNANRFIYSYISYYIYTVVGIINADGSISFSAPCYSTQQGFNNCMVQFSPWEANKFIVAGAGDGGCYAGVGTITNNVPSFAGYQTITTEACNSLTFALDKLTPGSMAIVYFCTTYSYGYYLAASISGGSISFGSINSLAGYYSPTGVKSYFNHKVAGNWIFIINMNVIIKSFQVSGSTVTLNSSVTVGTGYIANYDVDKLGDIFVVSYYDNGSPHLSFVLAFTITTGGIIIAGAPTQFESDGSGIHGYVAFDPQTPNRFFLMYTKSSVLYIREGNINNYVITLNSPEAITVPFNSNSYNRISLSTLKTGFMMFQDANARILSGYIDTTVSNINSSRIIGVLTEGGVLNDVKNVSLMGGIYNGFSGLTIGATYYVTPAGAITSTYAARCFLLGKALSATCIQLKANIYYESNCK